jgi:hypothetical protein
VAFAWLKLYFLLLDQGRMDVLWSLREGGGSGMRTFRHCVEGLEFLLDMRDKMARIQANGKRRNSSEAVNW